mmetsp:Transcript_11600/g.32879  ORF Transcript_11600/g.32879 Transcript_11600/m.32879 type:complete len:216 (+) Transcript_11600:625-1272(+)
MLQVAELPATERASLHRLLRPGHVSHIPQPSVVVIACSHQQVGIRRIEIHRNNLGAVLVALHRAHRLASPAVQQVHPAKVVTSHDSPCDGDIHSVQHPPGFRRSDSRDPAVGIQVHQRVLAARLQVQYLAGAVGGCGADVLRAAGEKAQAVGYAGVQVVDGLLVHLLKVPSGEVALLVTAHHHVEMSWVEGQAGHPPWVELHDCGLQVPMGYPEA